MTAVTHLALSQEMQRLKAENAELRVALGCVLPAVDNPHANTIRLIGANIIAQQALARSEVAAENATAAGSVLP